MPNEAAPETFDCPHCGAPLVPEIGARLMQCHYCNASVIIPKELRLHPKRPQPVQPQKTLMQALRGPAAPSLSFGLGLKKGCVRTSIVVAAIAILVVASLAIGIISFVKDMTKDIPGVSSITSGFAAKGLTFGSKGIGPGMFSDARSVAVESNGDILVGDYHDGRIQTFDPAGKYLSTFSVGNGSVRFLAVGPDGKVYVAHDGIVSIYEASGQETGSLAEAQGADALAFGADRSLYILTDEDVVERFDASGNLILTIPNAFSSVTGMGESTQYIAVDGIGNIYIVGDYSCLVLKYSSTGQYLDQFGGKAESSGPAVPGTLFTPSGIAVDRYGRVFVSDWNTDVQVFDKNGAPLQSVDALTLGFTSNVFGMAIDNQDRIYLALGDKVMVLKIKAAS